MTDRHPGGAPPARDPRRHFFEKPENLRRLFGAFYVLCALLVALGRLAPRGLARRYLEHPWERLVDFYPLYGFLGISVLVIAAKGLRRLVMRPEDYYDRD